MEAMTKEWLGRHYPGVFDDVLFGNHYGTTGAKMGKPEMCSSIGAVCLIDDSLKYVFCAGTVVDNAVEICTRASRKGRKIHKMFEPRKLFPYTKCT
jgi:hypothetical protein